MVIPVSAVAPVVSVVSGAAASVFTATAGGRAGGTRMRLGVLRVVVAGVSVVCEAESARRLGE